MTPSHTADDAASQRSKARSRAGKISAETRWGLEPNRSAATQPARDAFEQRFLDQVPAEVVDPEQRHKMAANLKRAHFLRLAHKSAEARRKVKDALEEMADVTNELDQLAG